MSDLAAAALSYAAKGWPVLPCKPHAKTPLVEHGLHDATTSLDAVRAWWRRWPDANIGLRTGVLFDVLDVDSPDGLDVLGDHIPAAGAALSGPTVVTGHGWHSYLKATGHGNRAGLLDHVDWRGRGGYVIAPPSVHPSGAIYRWAHAEQGPIRPAPAWLLQLLTPSRPDVAADRPSPADRYGRQALESELGRLAVSPVGSRNRDLYYAAVRLGQLAAGGHLSAIEAIGGLVAVGVRINLSEREVEATVRSGMRFGLEHRRP